MTVTATGMFGDPDMRELVRSGFCFGSTDRALALGLFNDLEGTQEWESSCSTIRQDSGTAWCAGRPGISRIGSFATLSTAQAMLERPFASRCPQRSAQIRYNFVLTSQRCR
jgi:hypothetical protein